jgi:desumoylating isopeptidase 1
MQVLDMGETAIDEETFQEYINELRDHYTADKVCTIRAASELARLI